MALGLPSPPTVPTGPLPPPPNVLLFEFDIPRPGTYRVRVACGDALVAVSNQQIQVFDGTTLLSTLFTGLSAPADNYIDAQGNVLSATNWPGLNASVVLIFQTAQVVFGIGDGVNHTFVASLQVTDAVGLQTLAVPVYRRLRTIRRRRPWHKGHVYPFIRVAPPFSILAREPPRRLLRVRRRPPLHVQRPRKIYPVPRYVAPIVVREPPRRRATWPRRKPLHTKKRQLLPRIIPPPPPLFVPYNPLPHPRIRRMRHFVTRREYPLLPVVRISVENPNPTAKIVVIVN